MRRLVIPEIETERLLLRGFRDADVDALVAVAGDPEVADFLTDGRLPLRESCWRQMALWIGHWALRGFGIWAVEERASGKFIDRIGIWQPEGWPGTEVGWLLGKAWWGHGFALEAARASVDWAFRELDIEELVSIIQPDNVRSIRVAERLGERPRGMIPFRDRQTGLWAITRTEWESQQAVPPA